MSGILIREDREETVVWRWRQRLEGCGHKPRNFCGHQMLEEVRNDSPLEPPEGVQPY